MTAAIRLRVWLTRRALDRRLASGADPTATSALQLRAEQLTAPGSRRALADAADAIRCSGVAPDARGELETLVRRLRSAKPIRPAGAARAHLLLQIGGTLVLVLIVLVINVVSRLAGQRRA